MSTKQVIMAMFHLKVACALVVLNIFIMVSHAASASGYCPWRTCGANAGVSVRYPFRLVDDALDGRCYTNYTYLMFECVDNTLYLNFTGNITSSDDTYEVTQIDYWNQILSLVPYGSASTCRPFDPSRFGGLNITSNSTLLLDCDSQIKGSCTLLPASNFTSACNTPGMGVNDPIVDRWSCPMSLNNYNDPAYSICYLMEQDLLSPYMAGVGSSVLELQFTGNRTLSFTNFSSPPVPSPGPGATAAVPAHKSSGKKKRLYIILGLLSGFLAAFIIILSSILCWCRSRSRHSSSGKTDSCRRKNIEAFGKMEDYNLPLSYKNHPTTLYTLKELQKATNKFSDECKLGSGGFGTVYKGTLDNGVEVAIKRTNHNVGMKGISEQFINEVSLLSQLNHRNLVRLQGCCLEVEVPMLVYEYVSNGDLYQHLQGERPGIPPLSWEMRLQIAIDTAEALRYLHSAAYPPIYHRDMKTSNILLDDKFNVKVADFGISKLVKPDATHVSTAVQGTPGYLDPEYFRSFQLTDKSDVYSFGMVLLELVTSLKPVDFRRGGEDVNLATMALPFIEKGDVKAIADSRLFDESAFESCNFIIEQMQRASELASKCLADSRHRRPTMKEVVAELIAIRGVENRAGQDSSEIIDMDREGIEMAPVLENQLSNSTSSSHSFYTRHSKSPLASDEVNRWTK